MKLKYPFLCSQRNFLIQLPENVESFVWGNSTLSSLMSYCFRNAVYQSGLGTVCNAEMRALTEAETKLSSPNLHLVTSLPQMLRVTEPVYSLIWRHNYLLSALTKIGRLRIDPLYFYESSINPARQHPKCFTCVSGSSYFGKVKISVSTDYRKRSPLVWLNLRFNHCLKSFKKYCFSSKPIPQISL